VTFIWQGRLKDKVYKTSPHTQIMIINEMKQKLGEEYLNCAKSILKTKLNGKNTIKAINTYATPVLISEW